MFMSSDFICLKKDLSIYYHMTKDVSVVLMTNV